MNDIKPIKFCGVDSKRPVVIAGPCSAETEEQVMETAKDLAKNGVRIFRAGIWKPRTKPGGFEGVGSVGLTFTMLESGRLAPFTVDSVLTANICTAICRSGTSLLNCAAVCRN